MNVSVSFEQRVHLQGIHEGVIARFLDASARIGVNDAHVESHPGQSAHVSIGIDVGELQVGRRVGQQRFDVVE